MGLDRDLMTRLKRLVEELRKGDLGEKEASYRRLLEEMDPFALDTAEDALAQEGLSKEEMRVLCDAHVRFMGELTEAEEAFLEQPGHPIHTLMEEHAYILRHVEGVRDSTARLARGEAGAEDRERLQGLEAFFKEAQKHFQREENILFPYLERHGITGPPARMWAEHDVLRRKEKELAALVRDLDGNGSESVLSDIMCAASQLLSLLNAHFYKENHVLFPTSIRVLSVLEWNDMSRQFDEVGGCYFIPHHVPLAFPAVVPGEAAAPAPEGEIVLPTGRFTVEELEVFLNNLPVDVTYVDKEDRVRYFSGSPDRIFLRTPAVLGRQVQNCHPQKSVHVVQRIVDDFKAGKRDQAEFWLQLEGRFVHIRYWPLRDRRGEYMGVLEMVQDVTGIRQLEGEKRLLDG